jgi:hypothetical protein
VYYAAVPLALLEQALDIIEEMPMKNTILVGAYDLVSCENRHESGAINYPLGPDAKGVISYSPDGFVFVHIMANNRNNHSACDLLAGETSEIKASAITHIWIISELVVVKKGKTVSHQSKQNGHPVTPKDIGFSCEDKLYPKEACDVRTHYSTLFSVSSNQNCRSARFGGRVQSPDPDTTRQALSAHLPLLWPDGLRGAQLDRA